MDGLPKDLDIVLGALGLNESGEAALRELVERAVAQAYTDGYRAGHHDTKYAIERFISESVTIKKLQEGSE